jgi:hypothetical protein
LFWLKSADKSAQSKRYRAIGSEFSRLPFSPLRFNFRPQGTFVKKSLPYEIIAALLGLFGAFLLVIVYMPLINPGQTKIETHHGLPSAGYYIMMTPIPLAVLLASWYFNRKAQQRKRDEKQQERKHRTLKWILFGFVVLMVLMGFLW